MAPRGPLPQQHSHRAARRASAIVKLTPDDELRGPPLVGSFSESTLAWYDTWRRSPQAQLFEATDWLTLQTLAPLYEIHTRRPSAASTAEIRITGERLGATVSDRLRLNVQIQREEHVAEVRPINDRRARLRDRLEPDVDGAPF